MSDVDQAGPMRADMLESSPAVERSGRRRRRSLGLVVAAATAAACSTSPPPVAPVPPPEPPPVVEAVEPAVPRTAEIGELWIGEARPEEGIAAITLWEGGGDRPWLLAAATATHRLLVFDAVTGELLVEHGAEGEIAGRFRRPGGLAVAGGLALVAEAGNGRVQVLRLPGLSTAGFLGSGILEAPSLLAASPLEGAYEVWVADRPEPGDRGRIVRLRFSLDGDSLRGEVGAPVQATPSGGQTLAPLTALGADPARERLLVAERGREGGGLWILDRDGAFAGRVAEGLGGEPPGLALLPCGDVEGWWIAAAPGPGPGHGPTDAPTRFLLLDRSTLETVGSFTGRATRGVRALAVAPAGTPGLPAGAVFSVGVEGVTTAFDWRDVAAALDLPACGR